MRIATANEHEDCKQRGISVIAEITVRVNKKQSCNMDVFGKLSRKLRVR